MCLIYLWHPGHYMLLPVDGAAEVPKPPNAGAEVVAVPKPEVCAPLPNVKPDISVWESGKVKIEISPGCKVHA